MEPLILFIIGAATVFLAELSLGFALYLRTKNFDSELGSRLTAGRAFTVLQVLVSLAIVACFGSAIFWAIGLIVSVSVLASFG